MLKGRSVATGTSKLRWKLSASLSAASLLAAYGDCACNGCVSLIGTVRAVPYVSLVEVWTIRPVPCRRTASSTLSVPTTFVSTYERGAVYE